MCAYSQFPTEIERFSFSYWMGYYRKENIVIALTGYNAYFDKSSRDDSPDNEIVVAGFVSSVEQWSVWEIEWTKILARYDVPYFHRYEMDKRINVYAKDPRWRNPSYREEFVMRLAKITVDWTLKSVCGTVKQSVFDAENRISELDKRFTPYSLCARDCAVRVKRYLRDDLKSELPRNYIFEQGDDGAGLLHTEMTKNMTGFSAPVFKKARPDLKNPENDKTNPPAIQLQAADLIAWEIRRAQEKRGQGIPMNELTRSFQFLKQDNSLWFVCKDTDMAGLRWAAGLKPRSPITKAAKK